MYDFLKMALNMEFLLFLLGIFWTDIAIYIQKKIANCNPKLFSLITAAIIYLLIKVGSTHIKI